MIKNLIFDLGGVLLRLDKAACIKAFGDLGYVGFDKVLSEFHQSGYFMDFEKGKISAEEFRSIVKENCLEGVTDGQIDDAMKSFLIGIPKDRLDYILELRNNFKVYMLSNTNPIAMKIVEPMFVQGDLSIEDYFDKMFMSFKMNTAKPDEEIFVEVLNDLKIVPEETLFIDDAHINLKSAEKLGIKTLYIDSVSDFRNEIEKRLNEDE